MAPMSDVMKNKIPMIPAANEILAVQTSRFF